MRTAKPGEINYDALDRFTLGHFSVGVILGLARVTPGWAAAVAIGWEFIERPLKDMYPEVFPHSTQDTARNAAVDALAMLAGYGLIRSLPPNNQTPVA